MPQTTSYHSSSGSTTDRSSSSSSCNSPLNKHSQSRIDSPMRNQLRDFNISTPPPKKRPARSAKGKKDDTDEDVDDQSSIVSISHSSRKSLFIKEKICNGYDPKISSFF